MEATSRCFGQINASCLKFVKSLTDEPRLSIGEFSGEDRETVIKYRNHEGNNIVHIVVLEKQKNILNIYGLKSSLLILKKKIGDESFGKLVNTRNHQNRAPIDLFLTTHPQSYAFDFISNLLMPTNNYLEASVSIVPMAYATAEEHMDREYEGEPQIAIQSEEIAVLIDRNFSNTGLSNTREAYLFHLP